MKWFPIVKNLIAIGDRGEVGGAHTKRNIKGRECRKFVGKRRHHTTTVREAFAVRQRVIDGRRALKFFIHRVVVRRIWLDCPFCRTALFVFPSHFQYDATNHMLPACPRRMGATCFLLPFEFPCRNTRIESPISPVLHSFRSVTSKNAASG